MERVFAQTLTFPGGSISGPTELSWATNLGAVVNKALPYVFAGAGMGLLIMLISGGFDFLTSAGDPKKMQMAQQKLTNALIGFGIIFVAYWLVQILGYIFGISEFGQIFR